MKILHVTNYGIGGAGIAAYRLHTALRKDGIDSRMLVRTKGLADPFVSEVSDQKSEVRGRKTADKNRFQRFERLQRARRAFQRLPVRARGWLGTKLTKALGMEGCSLNIFPTGLHKILNASDADVIHLHWINNEMISIKEIAKITKPIVWTLHDCWPLLGAEHHSGAEEYFRRNLKLEDGNLSEEDVSHKKEIFSQPLPLEEVRGSQRGCQKSEISGRSSARNKRGCCKQPPCDAGLDLEQKDPRVSELTDGLPAHNRFHLFFRVPLRSFAVKNPFRLTCLFSLTNKESGCKNDIGASPFNAVARAVNTHIFRLKQRAWKQLPVSFIAPSTWMAEQVQQSKLFADAPVAVIPNCLDLDVFRPLEKEEYRRKWNLPLDKKLILFGAYNPMDPNKGLDLLEEALWKLSEDVRRGLGVVMFGCDGEFDVGGLPTSWLGKVSNAWKMAEIYNAADGTCVPSRLESFGQTASESLACGIPVVAFCTSGLKDVVDHKKNGYLAEPFDAKDLAVGVEFVVNQTSEALAESSRAKAVGCFGAIAIVDSYLSTLAEVLKRRV